tara:strand:+ start:379 stop:2277 length:1899 start_codon:yes stop_codon:yes gene_type:complete
MCGITLCLSKNNNINAIKEVLNSLYELQNRGYDSFGIAFFNNELNSYKLHKKSINCDSDNNTYESFKNEVYTLNSNICMGHSRWATHGTVNVRNAHPHVSNNSIFYLVHNGIIENYKKLKDFLIKEKYTFYSETDSEVIVNLIEYFYLKNNLSIEKAIYSTIQLLEGTYGLVIIHNDDSEQAYIIKKGSPLIVSETNNEIMATSELCGLNKNMNNYYELENNELVILSKNKGIIFNNNNLHNTKDINIEFKEKFFTQKLNNYSHYIEKEIMEQHETLYMSINQGARLMSGNICLGGLNDLRPHLSNIQNIIFIGCGSSYYAGCIGYHYIKSIPSLHNMNVFFFDGGDFNINEIPNGVCLFVFISQSGETMDLIKHLEEIQKYHYTIGIINVIDSTIAKEVDCGIYMNVGKEVSVASTKSFNSSVLLVKLFSLWLCQELFNNELITDFIKNETLQINQMIYQVKKINSEIHDIIKNVSIKNVSIDNLICEHIFILGKNTMEYISKECALKLKEICYIHGEGLSASSLKHGPLAMIDDYFPVIMLINHQNKDKMLNAYHELNSRKAYILIITSEPELIDLNKNNKCNVILIPKNKSCSEILFMLTLQNLCYYLAIKKNINPDKPKNLAKVVTVE